MGDDIFGMDDDAKVDGMASLDIYGTRDWHHERKVRVFSVVLTLNNDTRLGLILLQNYGAVSKCLY